MNREKRGNGSAAWLAGAALGSLWGVVVAWGLAAERHHVELGFWREALSLLRNGAVVGVAAGIAFGAIVRLRSRSWPGWARAVSFVPWRRVVAEIQSRPGAAIAAAAAAQLGLLVLALRPKGLGARSLTAVILAWAFWSFGHALYRLAHPAAGAGRAALAASVDVALAVGGVWLLREVGGELATGLRAALPGAIALGIATALVGAFAWRSALGHGLPGPIALPAAAVAAGALIFSAGLALGAFPDRAVAVSVRDPWNVVLIGVDTLRLDATSLVEEPRGERDLTPNLRRLAKRGSVFRNAVSQAPWTLPAWASVFTGKYPHAHGAQGFRGLLRPAEVTLAELLREAGYRTFGVVSHFLVNGQHGFAQGFERYNEDYVRAYRDVTSHNVTDVGLRFLEEINDEPFFLFLHYFDPHYTYNDHPDWRFADGYAGWLIEQMHLDNLRAKRQLLTPDDRRYLRDLYDEEVAFTDREIGRLLDALESRDLLDRTILIFVSDHGEEFLERGWLGHTVTLYDELVRVPLVVVLPGFEHAAPVVDEVVETRAVWQTALEHLGLDWTQAPPGPSLVPLMRGDDTGETARAFTSSWLPSSPLDSGKRVRLAGLRTNRWKLIVDHTRDEVLLYDLARDPGERENLAEREPEQRDRLRAELDAWLVEGGDDPELELDAEMRERLKALGYL